MSEATLTEAGRGAANPRLAGIVESLQEAIGKVVREQDLSYEEYRAGVQFLAGVQQAGELPLLIDVFLDAIVEGATHPSDEASPSGIQGPYYVPGAPMLESPCVMPMREDEPGDPLVFSGQITGADGSPLTGAEIDLWHATAEVPGRYSMVSSELPEFLLRGRMRSGEDGRFEVRTVMPAPYEIPNQGPTGELLKMLGRHAWRPAHIHAKISAPGHRMLTTQIYFAGGDYLDADAANAVKPELIRTANQENGDATSRWRLEVDFRLQPA